MLDNLIEKLLKFNKMDFAEGEFVFLSDKMYIFLTIAAAIAVVYFTIYFITNIYTSKGAKYFSLGVRLLVLLLMMLPLLEPVLMTPDVIPNESFVVFLADNSNSMKIPDGTEGVTRFEEVKNFLSDGENPILSEIGRDFKTRYYQFSDNAERIDSLSILNDIGSETNISAALRKVLSDFNGLPLAGVVMFTDGGDNSLESPLNLSEEMGDKNIPLYMVGVGKEELENEREILEAEAVKGLSQGTGAEVDVKVRSWIKETKPVPVSLYKGESLVFSEDRMLKGDGKIDYFSFYYDPDENVTGEYTVKIGESAGEENIENNYRKILLNSKKDSIRVLYFEGHLRNEFKFIKRSLQDDQIIEFTSVLRTGRGKYYRQGIKEKDELEGGFPKTEEELNKFKAVIFGDVEASYFTLDQISMVEDFVLNRGGGFLMIGGLSSLAEGNYNDTPIASILPVELDLSKRQVIPEQFHRPTVSTLEEGGYRFVPTREGLDSPILKLSADIGANGPMWDEMPRLTSINYLGEVKLGATVLAVKEKDQFGEETPILVTQNYGRGRAAVLATSGTWRWQMQRDSGDQREERFWRQLVRWLVTEAPDKINVEIPESDYSINEKVELRVEAFDNDYNPDDSGEITAEITEPGGVKRDVSFRMDFSEPGVFIADYYPQNEGIFNVNVEGKVNGGLIGKQEKSFLVTRSRREFLDASLKKNSLVALSETSGGAYFEMGDLESLPDYLKSNKTSTSIFHTKYIWDMPLLYILILLLLSAEWIYRRRKGLP